MKFENGMTVRRKDTKLVGTLEQLNEEMWKVNYIDGTSSYCTNDTIEALFVGSTSIPYTISSFDEANGVNLHEPSKLDGYKAPELTNDLIDKQEHYTNNGIQPIEIMKANMTKEKFRGFLEGNILKYPLRYEDKNGLEDLKKAKTYLTWLIEDIEERGL